MPRAGDEGYEDIVTCPYDRAHDVRKGRMQFHLKKCRTVYSGSNPMAICLFNSSHTVPKMELQYHMDNECPSRANWDKFTYDVGDSHCPVKDLVPVNAATVPDGGENWDDFESTGSVLENIKQQAEEKGIFRMMQCESRAKRKNFRNQERLRHQQLQESQANSETSSIASGYVEPEERPPPPPRPLAGLMSQNPNAAIAELNKYFRTLDVNSKTNKSETSSMCNDTVSEMDSWPPLSQEHTGPSASSVKSFGSRPSTSMSMASNNTQVSNIARPTAAQAILASVKKSTVPSAPQDKDGFYQIPIPGMGRGRRAKQQQ